MQSAPRRIESVGDEIAVLWADGAESYFPHEYLREKSPSAENQGEVDILGNRHGGDGPRFFPGVRVVGWERVGNYAVCFHFSDGHSTGIYSWDYLRRIDAERECGGG
jgi:DUF971 family protein